MTKLYTWACDFVRLQAETEIRQGEDVGFGERESFPQNNGKLEARSFSCKKFLAWYRRGQCFGAGREAARSQKDAQHLQKLSEGVPSLLATFYNDPEIKL